MEILIIGVGEIGFHLCQKLSLDKHNITVVEADPIRADKARELLDARIIEGSGSSPSTLKEAEIEKYDIVAALTNDDETNIIACQIAKKFGSPVSILRVRNPEFLNPNCLLSKKDLGADFIVQPEMLTANAIVQLIRQTNATDVIEFEDGKIQLIGVIVDKKSLIINEPLKNLGKKFSSLPMRILAIPRRQMTLIPRGDDLIKPGDQIYFVSDADFLPQALKLFGKSDVKVEDIMIIGGGLVGRFLAQQLEEEYSIKIIEINEKKSEKLAEDLQEALVINGDGSDLDLLTFEGLADMDEVVAVTGDDETNIITNLVANHLKGPRTIALVSKLDYIPLTPAIGLESIVNKQIITGNAIQQVIRKQNMALFAELPGLEAEIIEYIAGPNSKITKKPLYKIDFPKSAIVGAVIKNKDTIKIPRGDTEIAPGDRVIVFALPKSLKDVYKLFQ